VEDSGKGHTREGGVGSVNVASLRIPILEVASGFSGCEKQMDTKGKRLDGMVFNNANPRYAGKVDDPQGGETTMLMQQAREVTTVNQEMEDESSWIWLTSEQMGFLLRWEFANENHGEARSSRQCNDQRTDQWGKQPYYRPAKD